MDVLPVALVLAGLMGGGLVVVQILRWFGLLYTAFEKHGGDFLGPPRRRLLWILPFVLVIHPGAWLLGFVCVITVRALSGDVSREWLWSLGGFYLFVIFITYATYMALRSARRSAPPNART